MSTLTTPCVWLYIHVTTLRTGLIATERNYVTLWEKGVPGHLSPWDLKERCESYALTIQSTDGGNEPGVAPTSRLAGMPRSLQSLCGKLGSFNVIAYGFGNEMACVNDFRSKPPQRLLHARHEENSQGGLGKQSSSGGQPPLDDPTEDRGGAAVDGREGSVDVEEHRDDGARGQWNGNVKVGPRKRRRRRSTPANCAYVEFGILDWPFVFVMTTPTVDKIGNVNLGAWCTIPRVLQWYAIVLPQRGCGQGRSCWLTMVEGAWCMNVVMMQIA